MTFSPFGKPPAPASGAINVTSYNQSGGITAHTVNLGVRAPRQIDAGIIATLDQNISPGSRVIVTSAMGDVEAYAFAEQLSRHLQSRGSYQVEGVNQGLFMPPVRGTQITLNQDKGGPVEILVGSNG